ncbi:ribonucleoside hydrolase RihC [Staphylococcus haemolyticus]|uniref:ribonucleoside hydrolase RihC n=1 Tax=Staphylococcus haemolyticus TaxID=1283 RepID=UPI00069CBE85|nr:ribonucleoside hydrolase RihC [Staphylococcus haemolyticus]SIK45806.1 Inosine-uridine nucleoside N-ribohydrolase [Mycobacteroides abscessus subsp. abscessus]MBE7355104.1 ribonucleoside hydrolase RihC [Staphylococcus haemolyticus]MDT0704547.1 ribonucleoside hydrolase RihC [Staphylococcus haemolyticus]MDT0737875.1 ribonucleoside hydrolase RihC [Staphylococcus haemolyticus]MEB5760631.1 ribonucleoside hydrolase RihC [Staphylococcus haemolyticus]
MTLPIIIDTDPGIDDAAALSVALLHPFFDVKMISTVNGNVNIEKTTANALKLKAFFNSDVPVHRGSAKPLINKAIDASQVHGESGMDGYDFPSISNDQLASTNSITAMKEILLHSNTPITLIALGPLTNIALLISTFPEVKNHIREIVLMGGSSGRGNVTPLAEFNIYSDPEAAHIVFESDLPITMIGLDLARQSLLTHDYLASFEHMSRTSSMLYQIFQHYREKDFAKGLKLYDVFTVLYLFDPESYETILASVRIELHGTLTKGATVVDYDSPYPNCKIVTSSLNKNYCSIFKDTIK